ncbi:MAG: ribonuclease HII [Candidatus Methylomirabilia bacterium]
MKRAVVDIWQPERRLRALGFGWIAGVDEAGRGPLAGPVVAAAVIFPAGFSDSRINDSKRLGARRREELVPVITAAAAGWAVAVSSEAEIDAINILQATLRAMERAVAFLQTTPDYLLVDGSIMPGVLAPGEAVIGGDGRVACIAAASILAKVHRDRLMRAHHERWPVYGFDRNKGYGTAAHLAALEKHGPCPIHRRSFRRVLPEL